MKSSIFPKSFFSRAMAGAAAGFLLLASIPLCPAQTTAPADTPTIPQDLPPGAQDVVKLTQAGLDEDVIVAQVRSGGHIYRLTADQIIELSNAGVSQNVIRALIGGADSSAVTPPSTATVSEAPAAAPAPDTTAPAAAGDGSAEAAAPGQPPLPPATLDAFQNELSPYGMWVQTPDYGWVWVPSVVTSDSAWQPYCDQGQWLYSDQGWYWNSFYPWGRIPFHYGRWARMAGYGWGWIPDYTWGPSWVCWRHDQAGGYCGWAPLPPGAVFVAGRGMFFHGLYATDIDFGLRWDAFVFCSYGHLFDRNLRMSELSRERVAVVFDHTIIRNNYTTVNGRVAVESLGRERMEVLTHRSFQPVALRAIPARDERGRAVPQRTYVPVRRDLAPADRAPARVDGRAPDNRIAPGERAPAKDSERTAPAREAPRSAPAERGSSQAESNGGSSDKKAPDRTK
jgi:hypothetical protein